MGEGDRAAWLVVGSIRRQPYRNQGSSFIASGHAGLLQPVTRDQRQGRKARYAGREIFHAPYLYPLGITSGGMGHSYFFPPSRFSSSARAAFRVSGCWNRVSAPFASTSAAK